VSGRAAGPGTAPAPPVCPRSLAAIQRLVREELGCTCPSEVFERIEVGPGGLPCLAGGGRRIAIGGRLLIYLIEADDAAEAISGLPLWVNAGCAERDAAGMNRLRLVVVTAEQDSLAPALAAAFAALPGRDDRTHLHVLPSATVAGL
jgi:hypothetical protein